MKQSAERPMGRSRLSAVGALLGCNPLENTNFGMISRPNYADARFDALRNEFLAFVP